MRNRTRLTVLSLGVLLTAVPLMGAEAPGPQPMWHGLRIEYDPRALGITVPRVATFIQHKSLQEAAAEDARKKAGLPADWGPLEVITFDVPDQTDGAIGLRVKIAAADHDPPVRPVFLSALAAQIQAALRDAQRVRIKSLAQELARTHQVAEERQKELALLRADQHQLYEEAGQTDLERQHILDRITGWETELEKVSIELDVKRARRQAIEERIAEGAAMARERIEKDEIADELLRIVKIREQAVAAHRQLAERGVAPQAELPQHEVALAQARVEWLRRRETVGGEANRELLAKLNAELVMLSIELAEMDGRAEAISERLSGRQKLLSLADRYQDTISLRLRIAETRLQNALKQVWDWDTECQLVTDAKEPTVTVIEE